MNHIFYQYIGKFVLVFLCDILTYTIDMNSHLSHLCIVFDMLIQNQLYINKEKCSFAHGIVAYLGHVISNGKVAMDLDKVTTISKWPTPRTVKKSTEAFKKLKERVISDPVLTLPNFSLRFKIERDASTNGLVAVLMQKGYPLAYFSKTKHGKID